MPTAPTTDRVHVLAALALEVTPGDGSGRPALEQQAAGALAELMARDLAGFAPDASLLELVTVGAHYDAVELLRPGWPLFRELEQLAARAPRSRDGHGGRIVAFGAHAGQLPGALTPSAEHAAGPLRLVPLLLGGDAARVSDVGDAFERELIERGMAGAATALAAQDAFGLRVQHARYLTLHDLLAMVSMQYEHAGIAALWPVLETALLDPSSEQWLDAPPEPLLHYTEGEARVALLSPAAWRARYAIDSDADGATLERRFAHFQARQRQFAAVLDAHGVPVLFTHCAQADAAEL